MSGVTSDEKPLERILSAIGLVATEHQLATLIRYLSLLKRWNETYNLTAVRGTDGMLIQHLADCAAVIPSLRRGLRFGRLLDVGSGAGLPGIVIATLLPDVDVTCVDSVGKKAAFVRQAAGELKLSNLQSVHARAEALSAIGFDVITSRAFGSLEAFTAATEKHLAAHGVWMAMKGKAPTDEISGLPDRIEVFHVEQLRVPGMNADRCLVWMRKQSEGASRSFSQPHLLI